MVLLMLILLLSPTFLLAALVVGLPHLARKREDRRPIREPAEAVPTPRGALDVRLSSLLMSEGDVLVGYTPQPARSGGSVATMGRSPSATGTVLLRLGSDAPAVLPVLDRWYHDGVVLELRAADDADDLVLSDRETAEQLDLTQLRPPR
jgi:hypothetical protein